MTERTGEEKRKSGRTVIVLAFSKVKHLTRTSIAYRYNRYHL